MKQLENQCMSIIMSSLSENDKKESLELLIYDDKSKTVVKNWLQFIIEK